MSNKTNAEQGAFLFDIQERFHNFMPNDFDRMILFGAFATGMIMQFVAPEARHEFVDAFAIGLKGSMDDMTSEGVEPSIRPA